MTDKQVKGLLIGIGITIPLLSCGFLGYVGAKFLDTPFVARHLEDVAAKAKTAGFVQDSKDLNPTIPESENLFFDFRKLLKEPTFVKLVSAPVKAPTGETLDKLVAAAKKLDLSHSYQPAFDWDVPRANRTLEPKVFSLLVLGLKQKAIESAKAGDASGVTDSVSRLMQLQSRLAGFDDRTNVRMYVQYEHELLNAVVEVASQPNCPISTLNSLRSLLNAPLAKFDVDKMVKRQSYEVLTQQRNFKLFKSSRFYSEEVKLAPDEIQKVARSGFPDKSGGEDGWCGITKYRPNC